VLIALTVERKTTAGPRLASELIVGAQKRAATNSDASLRMTFSFFLTRGSGGTGEGGRASRDSRAQNRDPGQPNPIQSSEQAGLFAGGGKLKCS